MDIKGAGLIAGAIVLVGGTWLYWTEIRPAQLREECSAVVMSISQGQGGSADLKRWVGICVDGGGWDNMMGGAAAAKKRQKAYAEEAPAEVGGAVESGE